MSPILKKKHKYNSFKNCKQPKPKTMLLSKKFTDL